jgi:hypothetical protein
MWPEEEDEAYPSKSLGEDPTDDDDSSIRNTVKGEDWYKVRNVEATVSGRTVMYETSSPGSFREATKNASV